MVYWAAVGIPKFKTANQLKLKEKVEHNYFNLFITILWTSKLYEPCTNYLFFKLVLFWSSSKNNRHYILELINIMFSKHIYK